MQQGRLERALANLANEARSLKDFSLEEVSALQEKVLPEIVEVLSELVETNTVSSTDPAKNQSVLPLAQRLADAFAKLGLEPENIALNQQADPLGVTQAGLTLRIMPSNPPEGVEQRGVAIVGHLDTVDEGNIRKWKVDGKPIDPFKLTNSATLEPITDRTEVSDLGEKLYGRGATDIKGPNSDMLALAVMLMQHRDKLRHPVYISFSWGEETYFGTEPVLKAYDKYQAQPWVFWAPEPTSETEVVTRHLGWLEMSITGGSCECGNTKITSESLFREKREVRLHGISAHSSDPRLGIDAIQHFMETVMPGIAGVNKFLEESGQNTRVNIYNIRTDNASNVITDDVRFGIEIAGDSEDHISDASKMVTSVLESATQHMQKEHSDKTAEGHISLGKNGRFIGATYEMGASSAENAMVPENDETTCHFLNDIVPKLNKLRKSLSVEDRYRQEGFEPPYPTINYYSLKSGEDGTIQMGISVRCEKEEVKNEILQRIREIMGCEFEIEILDDAIGLAEQGQKEKVAAVAKAMHQATGNKMRESLETGFGDTSRIFKWLKGLGAEGKCLVFESFPTDNLWGNIHDATEYVRTVDDLWKGFLAMFEVTHSLSVEGVLENEAIRDYGQKIS